MGVSGLSEEEEEKLTTEEEEKLTTESTNAPLFFNRTDFSNAQNVPTMGYRGRRNYGR